MTNVTIFDALCGSGKTIEVKKLISNSDPTKDKYLFITPFLGELHRIAQTTPRPLKKGEDTKQEGKTPPLRDKNNQIIYSTPSYKEEKCVKEFRFKQPEVRNASGSKRASLLYLLENRENIVSTHQLYQTFDKESLIDCKDYTLIIDEAISVYETYHNLSAKTVKAQIELGNMYLDDNGITIRMKDDTFNMTDIGKIRDATFDIKEYKLLCDEGMLLLLHGTVVMWKLPKELFSSFKNVIICTYQFRGSILETYFIQNNIQYNIKCWGKKPSDIKHLINIYEGPLNQTEQSTMYNYSWYGNTTNIDDTRKLLDNYFKNVVKASAKDRLWSCYTTYTNGTPEQTIENIHKKIGNKRYDKQWLAFNTKATNNFADRHNIAYMVNIHYKPALKDLINKTHKDEEDVSVKFKEELYAINEMIQFIWRSAIRNEEQINLFLPSERMRKLLNKWLNNEYEPYRTALSVQDNTERSEVEER